MNNILYIGIDFSINSPGICFCNLNTESNEKTYSFFSILRKKVTKKEEQILNRMLASNVQLEYSGLSKYSKQGEDSTNSIFTIELNKIIDCIEYIDYIIQRINNKIESEIANDIYIGIEGLSFGSVSGSGFDIAGYSYYLRIQLYKLLKQYNYSTDHLYVVPPTTIKKHAGKGNYKKIDMFNRFIDDNTVDNELKNFCKENFNDLVGNKQTNTLTASFVSDLIDSFFIVDYLILLNNL